MKRERERRCKNERSQPLSSFSTGVHRPPFFIGDHCPSVIVICRSQSQRQMQVWPAFMKLDSTIAIVDAETKPWLRLLSQRHNLKVVENDILEECMDVLSTLREVIILNRELKDMTIKSKKQCRDMAMVIERVGDKLNYGFAFIVVLSVVVVILVYLK
ncbi:hypothetical protein TEA_011893 [Camellia sinensis var. sinensis]|uniref:Uncharacterized protein n=1 Tax=Camellia sinensis var. sinensis TaxID=542762 RepID=A0A4S4EL99_CAMSN|nr:hypothetical protein TEA_011893 [Camellia sinensis var. sinensis]